MKTTCFQSLYALSFALFGAFCLFSCNQEENDPLVPPEDLTEPKREVSFVINTGDGDSEGIPSAPIVAEAGKPFEMTISQRSSYTDTNGKVYTCEPKATISLSTSMDTLYVKDLATLTNAREKSPAKTTNSGTNPVLTDIKQTFDIGGQEIAFDLDYEVYHYASESKPRIEMPYIKLNPARYGAAAADETRADVAVTGIRLTPIESAATRSTILRDSTMYKVSVSFNVDVESKNTGSDSKVPLSFEVEYIGVVENVNILPDPTMHFTYDFQILGGTASRVSPFVRTKGETLSLRWNQESSYTYFSAAKLSGKTIAQNPKVELSLSVRKDTLRVETKDEIEKVEELPSVEEANGENPTKHLTKQSFNIGGQVISIDWSYEAYAAFDVEGEQISLPYLELNKAELVSVASTELEDVNLPNESDKAYEVTVVFRQKLTGVNTSNDISENIEYIVKYIAVFENKLISTTYEKDYKWYEAHDNLPPTTYYVLRRIRTYASGEQIVDTFTNPIGWSVESGIGIHHRSMKNSEVYSEYQFNGDIKFVYHPMAYERQDYNLYVFHKTGVSDLSQVSLQEGEIFDGWAYRDLRDYMYIGNSSITFNPYNPVEGWYVAGVLRKKSLGIVYGLPEPYIYVTWLEIHIGFYDRFLYLDGQRFDFSEYMLTYDFNFREEPITMADGTPAKVFTHDLKAKYLDRDFYVAIVDTVYQLPCTNGTPQETVAHTQTSRNDTRPNQLSRQALPPYLLTPRNVEFLIHPFAATPILVSSGIIKPEES